MAEVEVSGWEPEAACPASAEGRGLSCRPEQASVELGGNRRIEQKCTEQVCEGERQRETKRALVCVVCRVFYSEKDKGQTDRKKV